jgi:hypothetical protein
MDVALNDILYMVNSRPFNVLHINRTFSKIKSYIEFLSRIVTIANLFILFLKFLEESFCFYKKMCSTLICRLALPPKKVCMGGRERGKLYLFATSLPHALNFLLVDYV